MDGHTGFCSHTGGKPVDWIIGQRSASHYSDSRTDPDLHTQDNRGFSGFGYFRTMDAEHHGRIYQ